MNNNFPDPRFPFGKFRGVAIRDCPSDYLVWIWDQDFLKRPLRDYVRIELENRRLMPDAAFNPLPRLDVILIETARRQLARQFHPDVTHGNDDGMKAINTFADFLIERLSA